jgi:thiopurine S-methyltransferase
MQSEFWHDRWTQGQIGFHEGIPNRFLTRFAERLGPAGASVFVPLCGKTVDLDALAARGLRVTGCELVERAVEDYFRERDEQPTRAQHGAFSLVSSPTRSVRIAVGDVFAFVNPDGPFDAVYDRAALVALAPADRDRYAKTLAASLVPGGVVLLVAMEHDLGSGPPFSVQREDVDLAFGSDFIVEELACEDAADARARFIDRGASYARERASLLTRR